jgi:T-complex protein 1 subunit gamma
LLRGASKDVLNEVERNLQDAMNVARNVYFNPGLAPGGGATEMAVAVKLQEIAKTIEGVEQWPYKALGEALEVIPRTLIQNCGGNAIKVLTQLRVCLLLVVFTPIYQSCRPSTAPENTTTV